MELYIANTTKKSQVFQYRLPEDQRPHPLSMTLRPGSQAKLPKGNLSQPDIDAIVGAHEPYGLIPVSEVNRTKPFIGMCYSIDKPIPLEAIQNGIAHNDEVLVKQGEEIRQLAAIAVNNAIEEQTGGTVNALEMSFVEENPDKHAGEGDALGEQTVVVTRDTDVTKVIKTAGKRGKGR